jgi:hypothetical protein
VARLPPRVETAYGEIPFLLLQRCTFLEELHSHPDGRGGKDEKLLLAAVALEQQLESLEEAWKARLLGVWRALRQAEMIASELLSAHLTLNLWRAHDERTRYLYPGRKQILPKAQSDDFIDLMRAIRVVAAARAHSNLNAIRTEQTLVTVVSMAVTVAAVASALHRGDVLLDRTAWDQITYANRLNNEAAKHTAEAMTSYLQVLRHEAREHPILLVLGHTQLADMVPTAVARAIDSAIEKAKEAIAYIRAHGANEPVILERREAQDLTCSGLAQRLADASAVSVWKLPFFVERALLELPPAQAVEVVNLMRIGADLAGGQAIRQNLAFFGIETAAMVAPAAGPIGIALALAWALFSLGKSIQEYQQLSALYHATLDPGRDSPWP